MRIFIAVIISLLSFHLRANFPIAESTNLNLNYSGGEGHLSADYLIYPELSMSYPDFVEFLIHKEENSLRIFNQDDEYVWEDFDIDLDSAVLSWFNIKMTQEKVTTTLRNIIFFKDGKYNEIQSLSGWCNYKRDLGSFTKELIDSCSTQSSLNVAKIKLETSQPAFKRNKEESVMLEKLDLSITNNQFILTVKAHLDIKTKIKVYGESIYNPETNILRVHIKKVKASLFNVTKKVFRELEKIESTHMWVERPFVYFRLDNNDID